MNEELLEEEKPIRVKFTVEDTQRNFRVSSDRVLIKNYFGIVTALWKTSRSTYQWIESNYDSITRLPFSLTDFHVSLMILSASDGNFISRLWQNITLKVIIASIFRYNAS